jgi:hypothetical protein
MGRHGGPWSLTNFQAGSGNPTGEDARPTLWRGRPRPRSGVWTFVGPGMLRRSKIFIVTRLKHAVSSAGAASNRDPQVGKCIFGHAAR